jgi:diguanylate cyclase (GGDEF)-like protein
MARSAVEPDAGRSRPSVLAGGSRPFKVVNDRHGHAAGDKILVQMRQRLEEVLHDTDYLVRWRGVEFLVVARDTNRADANNVAERIRAAVANRPFDLGEGMFQIQTCSIGFACFPFIPGNLRLVSWSQTVGLGSRNCSARRIGGRPFGFATCSNVAKPLSLKRCTQSYATVKWQPMRSAASAMVRPLPTSLTTRYR